MARLVSERLLEPVAGGEESDRTPAADHDAPKPAFDPPRLEKYSDMQDYLLIDPIHEVDEPGWPAKRET